ncbi:FAD-dependent oxidoreductase [Luteimonas sp. SDU82]|uniref:FAD-dependent oxidoreductase n=1 Tax=Luteimonas sp. SDU82 TaxID=3422592 RepID=UPI003EC0F1CA
MGTARTIPVWEDIGARTRAWWSEEPGPSGCDVVVVGAGIAGLTTALCLLREGREVLLVDRQGVGAGETLRTSAHLASALDNRFSVLARYHGREGARLAAASHAAAIDWIEALAMQDADACGFRRVPGYLFPCDGDPSGLEREAAAAADAGLDVALLRDGVSGLPALGPVLRFDGQARIAIGDYLLHLAHCVHDAGGRFLRAEATAIDGGPRAVVQLRSGGRLQARSVVSAANVPFHQTGVAWLEQAAYRTYVVAGHAPRGAIPDALYWDDGDPYHYVRLLEDGDDRVLVLVGGEDHKVGQDDDPEAYVRLQAWARRRFPAITHFTSAWSGQILEPADGLAFAGADPEMENVYLITGDSGNGLTHGTLGALLLCDLIQGRPNPWAELYDPARRRWASAGPWLKENLNSGAQYRDWIAPADLSDPAELTPGNGAVLRRGLRRLAVYRDGHGVLHAHDARCTHMGCVVRWSREEKSWDCPCHGSRFEAVTGAVLNGPASEPLAPCELDEASGQEGQ